jgi:hypothetical protein
MSDLFCWHIEFPTAETYARRSQECRRLAKLCPEHLKEGYVELAVEYERLAKEAEI